jgi:hypothetical protein
LIVLRPFFARIEEPQFTFCITLVSDFFSFLVKQGKLFMLLGARMNQKHALVLSGKRKGSDKTFIVFFLLFG